MGSGLQGSQEVPGHGQETSVVPQVPLRIPPSRFYLAFQGCRSCYCHLYQATSHLLRADKGCLAKIPVLTGTMSSANGSLSAHPLPALAAQEVVEPRWAQTCLSSGFRSACREHSHRELPGLSHSSPCPTVLLGCPWWYCFGIPMANSQGSCCFACP